MRLGDRRKNNRFECTHPVRYAYGDAPLRFGLLNDISTGGVLLATHEPVPDDVSIRLVVHDPRTKADVEINGNVRRRAQDLAYGIAFIEMSNESLGLVNYFLTVAKAQATE